MFISETNRGRIRRTVVEGAPDLIVEIVSPDSQNRDRRDKYLEYGDAGVREYWLIDPLSQTLDAYAQMPRDPPGRGTHRFKGPARFLSSPGVALRESVPA